MPNRRKPIMTLLVLNRPTASVCVDTFGGRLTSLRIDDLEVLTTREEGPLLSGCYPMAPWAGRLAFGKLAATSHSQPAQFPPTLGPHAIHGLVMSTDWTLIEGGDNTIRLRCELTDLWPFGGFVEQELALHDDRLIAAMRVVAQDLPFPAQLGWHPCFVRHLDRGGPVEVDFDAESMYVVDDAQIPTGELVAPTLPPWDDTFTGVQSSPVLHWPDAITIEMSSDLDHWVVFTQLDTLVAVEPQSGAPNDGNRAPQILQAGEELSGTMELRWAISEASGHEADSASPSSA